MWSGAALRNGAHQWASRASGGCFPAAVGVHSRAREAEANGAAVAGGGGFDAEPLLICRHTAG